MLISVMLMYFDIGCKLSRIFFKHCLRFYFFAYLQFTNLEGDRPARDIDYAWNQIVHKIDTFESQGSGEILFTNAVLFILFHYYTIIVR